MPVTRSKKRSPVVAQRPSPRAGGDLASKKLVFGNREQSWLAFNRRVLDQARNAANPLLERVKFLAIVSSNLDEFFEIRIAGLMQQADSEGVGLTLDGLTSRETLRRTYKSVHELVADQSACWHQEIVPLLAATDIEFRQTTQLDANERT